jgi:hypothetical protein
MLMGDKGGTSDIGFIPKKGSSESPGQKAKNNDQSANYLILLSALAVTTA